MSATGETGVSTIDAAAAPAPNPATIGAMLLPICCNPCWTVPALTIPNSLFSRSSGDISQRLRSSSCFATYLCAAPPSPSATLLPNAVAATCRGSLSANAEYRPVPTARAVCPTSWKNSPTGPRFFCSEGITGSEAAAGAVAGPAGAISGAAPTGGSENGRTLFFPLRISWASRMFITRNTFRHWLS